MAGANQIWDVRPSGSDSNGGGFNPANANFAADLACDTGTGNTANPVVSSASYNFVAGDVGAWVFIKSGTNWTPGWYQIASVATNKATLSAAAGAGILLINNNAVKPTTAAGVGTVATPTSGTWGIDYSQQTSAGVAYTDLVIDGTINAKVTSAAHPFGVNHIGNTINVTGGTGFTVQRVEVSSVTAGAATLNTGAGTLGSTGGTGNLGGALATPGQAGAVKIQTNDVFMLAGTYTLNNTTANTAGGPVSDTTGGADSTNPSWWVGHNGSRCTNNTDTTFPTISAGTQTGITLFSMTSGYTRARNMIVDGNSQASVTGFNQNSAYQRIGHIKAVNCTVIGIDLQGGNGVGGDFLWATGCSGTAGIRVGNTGSAIISFSESYGNTCHGIQLGNTVAAIFCIASGNTGASSDGFNSNSVGYSAFNCVAYGNGRAGFDTTASVGNQLFINCIAEGNATGWTTGAVRALVQLINCGGYNNSPNGDYSVTQLTDVRGFLSATGSFFVNAASGNFDLNNNAGGGALARAANFPGTFPRGTTTSYLDIGAAQHQDTGTGFSGAVTWKLGP